MNEPEVIEHDFDLSSDAETLADTMPDISENVVDAENAKREQAENVSAVDGDGQAFDPDIHMTDVTGSPILTAKGKLRKKAGRKKDGSGSSVNSGKSSQSDNNPDAVYEATGRAAAETIFAFGGVIGGEEWQPIVDHKNGINERETISDAFTAYVKAKGISDFPVGVALSIALMGYALPRFTMPKTKSRLQRFKEWTAGKIGSRRGKKAVQPKDK